MSDHDVKKLVLEELKKEGINLAEDAVAGIVKAVFRAIPKVVLATPNSVDDLLVPVLAVVEPKVLELVDKLDGEDDADR